MHPRDLLALVTLAALWGGSFLFIRISAPALGAAPLAAGRVVIAAFVLWIGMRVAGQRASLRPYWRELLVLGALNAAVPYALIALAELHLTASLTAMLNATVPLFGASMSVIWLGERLTAPRAAGLLVGAAGVTLLVGWSPVELTATTIWSIVATLAACACYAIATVYAKRRLAGVPTPTLALGQQVGATAWLLVPALWQLPSARPTPVAIGALLALAVLSTAIAYLLYFHLVATVGATRTTSVTYLMPVFGTIWGALFLGESITPGMLGGLGLVLVSMVLINGVSFRATRRLETSD